MTDAVCVEIRQAAITVRTPSRETGAAYFFEVIPMSDMEKVSDLHALKRAYMQAKKGKQKNAEAIRFGLNAMEGLCQLKWLLESQNFQMGRYSCFEVTRPVHRDVKSCSFKDKIVLGSLCKNVLWDAVNPHLILDNYASRKGLGIDVALDRLERNLRRYYINHGSSGYVLRMDVRKYFYSIPHDVLRRQIEEYGLDDWTLWLYDLILDSSTHAVNEYGEVGIPIGNEPSQVMAVQCPNKIDHYIMDQCGISEYGRYMDDSYIIHHDRDYLVELLETLRKMYLDLGLELNQKTEIYPLKNGVKFLGIHMYLTDTGKVIRRLRPENVRYWRVHIRENAEKVALGEMTEENFWMRFEATADHAKRADTNKLRKKMRKYAKEALKNAYLRQQRKLGEISQDINGISRPAY